MFNVGWISSSAAVWRQGEDPDRQIRFPVPCYVIDAGDERILIDTGLNPAGVGDPGGFYGRPEAFSLFKLELEQDISEQDAHIAGFILESGRALVVAVNKWDGLRTDQRDEIKIDIDRKLDFLSFAKTHFITALKGTGIGPLSSAEEGHHAFFAGLRYHPQLDGAGFDKPDLIAGFPLSKDGGPWSVLEAGVHDARGLEQSRQ